MTIGSVDVTSGPYSGAGTTDTYAYDFPIAAKTELLVYQTNDSGIQSLLTVDVDYTVTGVGDAGGGNVVLTAGNLASGYSLFIRSNREAVQETDFDSHGSFLPTRHEDAFDKLTVLMQQILDRAILTPKGQIVSEANRVAPVGNQNQLYGWDASGNPTTVAFADLTFDLTVSGGDAGKLIKVNATEDGIEVGDTPLELTISGGDAGKLVIVNGAENGVEVGVAIASGAATASTVVQRTASGEIFTATPTAGNHATNKTYVDGLISAINAENPVTADVTYQVGSGGDYATLNAALEDLAHKGVEYKNSRVRVTLNIATGESLSENIAVDGLDLGWITITGTDASTNVDIGSFGTTSALGSTYNYFMYVTNGGVGPVIEQKFTATGTSIGGGFDNMFVVDKSASLHLSADLDGNSKVAICSAGYGGSISTDTGLTFNNVAGNRAFAAIYGGRISVRNCTIRMAAGQTSGVYSGFGSYVNADNTTVNNDTGGSHSEGFECEAGSHINCRSATDTGATTAGFDILNGSTIAANGATGTLSTTANTVTAAGIIFQ